MEEKHFGPIWFLPGENRGKYPYCHSLYVEGAGVIIDPASRRERLAELRETCGVKTVWLSHWHEDHFMHLDLFDHLPLCVSERDAVPLSDLELFMDAYGMDHEDERRYWRDILIDQFHFHPRKPARFMKGGETIQLGDITVEIISTPGHTPGHLSFFFPEPGVLFMGDYDLTKFGPWYGDVHSSIEDTIRSVEYLREIPAKVWLTAHETGIFENEPGEIWDQYIGVIAKREEKLRELLKRPRTMEEIVGAWIVYGKPREPKAFFEFGERVHMKKHLEKLMKEGTVAMEEGKYFLL
ncbi:MAG: MBL fold metallo-hydrolase [Deltaproteobacteria bacterium]|nr:MBL fold metallo-hydrolase [Deltaproteobacteria bacterium]